jgi:hypothetical protein
MIIKMTIKKSKSFFLLLITYLLFYSCKPSFMEYKISDKYSGPCVVFVYSKNKNDDNDNTLISNGLGKINKIELKKKFIFKSIENGNELEIVPIGKSESTNYDKRYIYQLVKGTRSSRCSINDLQIITFFVGTKIEYMKWAETYKDELDYFDSKKVDWCTYYLNQAQGE